jgi:hypothetical protein
MQNGTAIGLNIDNQLGNKKEADHQYGPLLQLPVLAAMLSKVMVKVVSRHCISVLNKRLWIKSLF